MNFWNDALWFKQKMKEVPAKTLPQSSNNLTCQFKIHKNI
jgi:hypothetical protein